MVDKENYGTRASRATMESCIVCGGSVVLTELTLQQVDGEDFEVHMTEECEHETRRAAMFYCAPKDATEFI